ncbi:MAG: nicotinate (nicotinamide) nucleotide adenylyltransferase [Desulfovermiculus sp.]
MKAGLLGGSFNPVHNGHLRLALEALEQGGLDRVELVPAFIPPHKDAHQVPSFATRCQLIEAAIEHMPGLVINRMEGQRSGPSYTVDTLDTYHRLHPGRETYFLIGCPDFVQLPKWHQWERLLELTHFIVVAREEGDEQALSSFVATSLSRRTRKDQNTWLLPSGYSIWMMHAPLLEISSSLIRGKITQGKSIRYLVPDAVWVELSGSDRN